MTETAVQGLYLAPPHGELIATGKKVAIAKGRPMDLSGDWILLSGGHAYGHMTVGQPETVGMEDFKARRDEHGISEKERLRWWPETSPLYLYPVERFQPYPSGPVEVSLPPGVQTRVDTKGLGLPVSDVDATTEDNRQRVRTLLDGRKVIVVGAIPRRSKKSLTALILSIEETENGPVAIYGLSITDRGYDGDNGHNEENQA